MTLKELLDRACTFYAQGMGGLPVYVRPPVSTSVAGTPAKMIPLTGFGLLDLAGNPLPKNACSLFFLDNPPEDTP